MGWRCAVISTLLLVICTGCPHAWGRGGTLDEAMAKDIDEMMRRNQCDLSRYEWLRICSEPDEWEIHDCPSDCRIDYR